MKKILPDVARLLSVPIARRHAPIADATHARAYELFRRCLRWELAFSCPFCLLHEAQVCPDGAEGSSQDWIEHIEPQTERPELRNVYSNVLYTCRRCNLARRARARVDRDGRTLLDPCQASWAEHFAYDGDELRALTSDARYTAESYDVNAPAKISLRRDRREILAEATQVLAQIPAQLMSGLALQPPVEQRLRLEVAEQLHKALAAARRTLTQLSAVPHDAPATCTCNAPCELAPQVIATLRHVELEPGRE